MSARKSLAELRLGEVIVMAKDDETGQLHFIGHLGAPPHLRLVEATVSDNTALPGTAVPGEMFERAGQRVYKIGRPDKHRVNVECEGARYEVEWHGDHRVEVQPEHFQRCGGCGELWPCRDERLDNAAKRLTWELDDLCAHCGQPIGAAWSESFHDGLTRRRFHTAMKFRGKDGRRCKEALAEAKRSLPGVKS